MGCSHTDGLMVSLVTTDEAVGKATPKYMLPSHHFLRTDVLNLNVKDFKQFYLDTIGYHFRVPS